MKYFMVTVKCGHVGKNKYYKGTLFLKAENGRAAAKQARECPRVKHDHKDAILNVCQISKDDYYELRKENDQNHIMMKINEIKEFNSPYLIIGNISNVFPNFWIGNILFIVSAKYFLVELLPFFVSPSRIMNPVGHVTDMEF